MTINHAMDDSRNDSEYRIVTLPFSINEKGSSIRFFLNIQKVNKVVECDNLSKLPVAIKPFSYLYDYHDIPVPMIDLRDYVSDTVDLVAKMNHGSSDQKGDAKKSGSFECNSRRIIICSTLNHYVGLIVDKTQKVCQIDPAKLKGSPQLFTAEVPSYLGGLIKDSEGFRFLFDIETFLEHNGVQFHEDKPVTVTGRPLDGRKILIVEDSQLFQKLLGSVLTKYGAHVEFASDGLKGLEILMGRGGDFDLVIADIEMPLMDGIEMIRRYKNSGQYGSIPVLFHSSISNPALIDDIRNEGLGDYLVKFEENSIVEAIAHILHLHLEAA